MGSSAKIMDLADALMSRMLFLGPPHACKQEHAAAPHTERAFGMALLFSATRCLLQYVVFPLIWPLIGHISVRSIGIALVCDLVALASIIQTLRRLWRYRHPHRWRFVPLALLIAVSIIVFLAYDLLDGT